MSGERDRAEQRVRQSIDDRLAAERNGHADLDQEEDDIPLPGEESWPLAPSPLVYSGLPGAIVRAIEPETEADPAAILVQFLAMFGSCIGRNAHWKVEEDKHHGNLYVCLVGDTAVGRKGTSKGRALAPFVVLDDDDDWSHACITSGLSSGEGVVWAVRDPVRDKDDDIIDPGVKDKRLLVIETELAATLKVMRREGNTLSPVIRQGWDSGNLGSLTKNSRTRATGAHISIIGHVTRDELLQTLSDVEGNNGFANRFLWVAVRRSKLLPLGGRSVFLNRLADDLREAVRLAKSTYHVSLNDEASDLWCKEFYPRLSDPGRGSVANILGRGAAQTRRLAMLYALAGCRNEVNAGDLLAAAELWGYCERSVRWVFGDSTGDRLADELLMLLRSAGDAGMTQNAIRDYLGRHERSVRIGQALQKLLDARQVRFEAVPTKGRPAKRWFALCAKSAKSAESGGETTCAAPKGAP